MRRHPDIAKAAILRAALDLAREAPYHQLSLRNVANAASCSSALVIYHFKTMDTLRTAIVSQALEHKILRILGQAVINRHPAALAASQTLQTAAVQALIPLPPR